MNFMATIKKVIKKVVKPKKKVAPKIAIQPVVKGSPEWLAMKAAAKKRLDSR